MSYLKREDRRAAIIEAGMAIAVQDGLEAVTARAVAVQCGAALGQIHHHFKSMGEMRAIVFEAVIKDSVEREKTRAADTTRRDRIMRSLRDNGPEDASEISLWKDAVALADKDPEMKSAVRRSITLWQGWIAQLVTEGQEAGEFDLLVDARLASWHLLLMSIGLGSIEALGLSELQVEGGEHLELAQSAVLRVSPGTGG